MSNPGTFRDLGKPVGALNKERLERLLVRGFKDSWSVRNFLNHGLYFYSNWNSFHQGLGQILSGVIMVLCGGFFLTPPSLPAAFPNEFSCSPFALFLPTIQEVGGWPDYQCTNLLSWRVLSGKLHKRCIKSFPSSIQSSPNIVTTAPRKPKYLSQECCIYSDFPPSLYLSFSYFKKEIKEYNVLRP